MAFKYTEEQLQSLESNQVIKLFIGLQEDIERLTGENDKLRSVLEKQMRQMAVLSKIQFKRTYKENQVFRR